MIKSKKQSLIVIGVFTLVLMLGTVTYAFFNYTRTGEANTIRVGRIAFNTTQASGQDGAINLSNAFPITRTLAATDNTNAGEVVITITGDTSYSGGVEYLVTATDVTNTVNSKTVPISIIATASNGLGTADEDYFTNRGGNSSIYKVLANETVSNDDQLLVGYIAPDNNQTGVNGTITIRAYLDSDLVAISDTYNNGNTPTDNLGTPASFGEHKTVLTTTEWNSLRTTGVSFKVKVVAQEGTWVENPNLAWKVISKVEGLEEVAGAKRYVGSNPDNYVIFNNEQWRIIGVYGNQLKIVKVSQLVETQAYDDSSNAWEGSDLETYLNQDTIGGYYYNLSQAAKDMIVVGTWNVGATAHSATAVEAYSSAQTTQVSNKKVGLIAGYEYLYAAGESCREVAGNSYAGGNPNCGLQDWLSPFSPSSPEWTLSPFSLDSGYALNVNPSGGLNPSSISVSAAIAVRPVVYLNSEVIITSGTGGPNGDEYRLSYTAS